jgi:hypothetical protein
MLPPVYPTLLCGSGGGAAGCFTRNPSIIIQLRGNHPMNPHLEIALAHPVFDPARQINPSFFWRAEPRITVGLTCNIGME